MAQREGSVARVRALVCIRARNYPAVLAGWGGDTLLVGVTYDANTKAHACTIERLEQSDVLQPRSSPGTRLL